jgi:hypothetical protein
MALRDLSVVWLSGLATMAAAQGAGTPSSVPTAVGPLHRDGNFVSFTRADHPDNRIGYRFHEHVPFVWGTVPTEVDEKTLAEAERWEAEFAKRPGVLVNAIEVREEGWCPQDWTYYIVPVEDGFELLWVIEPLGAGLNEYYAAQQCFRMSGVTNAEWRRKIAETPAFSEFDRWAGEEAKGQGLSSLAHVRIGGNWAEIPATRDHVGYRTQSGLDMDEKRTDGNIAAASLDPYGPTTFHGTVDCGLATRADGAGEWACGLFWERTTHVTDHHPADCLHAVVNLGPIAPGGKRAIRGKIYWTKATLDELYEKWRRDFP